MVDRILQEWTLDLLRHMDKGPELLMQGEYSAVSLSNVTKPLRLDDIGQRAGALEVDNPTDAEFDLLLFDNMPGTGGSIRRVHIPTKSYRVVPMRFGSVAFANVVAGTLLYPIWIGLWSKPPQGRSAASLSSSLVPVATKSGTLVSGPITIAASASYFATSLPTNGYHYALFVPKSVTGSGVLAIGSNTQAIQGIEIGVHNAGSQIPPGMTGENGMVGFNPPINDSVAPGWNNSSSTASITLGDILYVMSA